MVSALWLSKPLKLNLEGSINLKSNKLNINKINVNDSHYYKKMK